MKDIVSKLTFSFFMAQLFPGAVATVSGILLYSAANEAETNSLLGSVRALLRAWSSASAAGMIFLLGVSLGFGMLIHGLHWATLAYLERTHGSAFDAEDHATSLAKQVVFGPLVIVRDTCRMLFATTHLKDASLPENVVSIKADKMAQFQFLQDFYLYSAQFFAHSAYALIVAVGAVAAFTVQNGASIERIGSLVGLYGLCGLFFVLGRVKLLTLFAAEEALVAKSDTSRFE